MPVQVWQYLREYEAEKEEILQAVETVLASGRLILGASVEAFEREFAAYCGVRYGVGVDNGTNAIALALRAIGVHAGDEVITVANTAVPTVSAIVTVGAEPRFVDIDPGTYLMDGSLLEQAITPRTTCIVPVHLYGQCVDMDAIRSVATAHGLLVMEDCAQAHGAEVGGRRAGSMSDAAAFSFYPTKPLGAYGDAGMVISDQDGVREAMRKLRFYGMEGRYFATEHGYNARLDEIHAEILRRKLRHLDDYIQRRRCIAARYDEELADLGLGLPRTAATSMPVYYLYVVRHPQRDAIVAELRKREIYVNISYPWPIHTMPPYSGFGSRAGDLPHTEAAAAEIFSLPMYPSLTDDEQAQTIAALKEILLHL